MKLLNLYIWISVSFVVIACSKANYQLAQERTILFKNQSVFTLPIDSTIKSTGGYEHFWIDEQGNGNWVILDYYTKELSVFSHPKGELLHQIPYPVKRYFDKKSFKYYFSDMWTLNDTSFIINFSPSKHPKWFVDSSLVIINKQGEIIKDISLEKTKLWHSKSENSKIHKYYYPLSDWHLVVIDNVVFVAYGYFENVQKLGLKTAHSNDSMVGFYDLKQGTPNFKTLDIRYPKRMYGKYWRQVDYGIYSEKSHRNTLLVSYNTNSEIVEYDPKTDNYKQHWIHSDIVDTITPITDMVKDKYGNLKAVDKEYFNFSGYYAKITYDPYRHLYYRTVSLPKSSATTLAEMNQSRFGIVVFDTNFVKIGETVLPKEVITSYTLIPTKEAVYFLNKEQTKASNGTKIVYNAYEIQIGEETTESCKISKISNIKELDNKGYLTYFKKYHKIPKKNSTAVVIYVPVEESCPYCVQQMYKAFDKLIQEFPDHELYLLATTESQNALDETKKSKNFPQKHPHLKTDASGKHLNYILRAINPRVFLLDEKKVVKAFDVMPADAPLVEGYIRTFFSGQTPIIK